MSSNNIGTKHGTIVKDTGPGAYRAGGVYRAKHDPHVTNDTTPGGVYRRAEIPADIMSRLGDVAGVAGK